jgi:hypothetical protein
MTPDTITKRAKIEKIARFFTKLPIFFNIKTWIILVKYYMRKSCLLIIKLEKREIVPILL